MLARVLEAALDLGVVGEPDRDTAAVVGVERLGHDREADVVRRLDGVLGPVDQPLLGDRQAERLEQHPGVLLVARDLDGDVPGLPRHRRLDALLVAAVAELDQ